MTTLDETWSAKAVAKAAEFEERVAVLNGELEASQKSGAASLGNALEEAQRAQQAQQETEAGLRTEALEQKAGADAATAQLEASLAEVRSDLAAHVARHGEEKAALEKDLEVRFTCNIQCIEKDLEVRFTCNVQCIEARN